MKRKVFAAATWKQPRTGLLVPMSNPTQRTHPRYPIVRESDELFAPGFVASHASVLSNSNGINAENGTSAQINPYISMCGILCVCCRLHSSPHLFSMHSIISLNLNQCPAHFLCYTNWPNTRMPLSRVR